MQLVTDGFVESVAEIIEEFGLDGKSVCLEITESVVVQDIETTRITLAGLKEVGVQVAIDDFGTGYSVLTHLKSLPVDTLKIDKSFVLELGSNPDDLAIVRAVIALAEAFGLELVAEGVESATAAMTLLQHGCHRAQGFLLSRPLPADEMAEFFARKALPLDFSAAADDLSQLCGEQLDPAEPAAGPAHDGDLRDDVAQLRLRRPCRVIGHRASWTAPRPWPRPYQSWFPMRCRWRRRPPVPVRRSTAAHPGRARRHPAPTPARPASRPAPRPGRSASGR